MMQSAFKSLALLQDFQISRTFWQNPQRDPAGVLGYSLQDLAKSEFFSMAINFEFSVMFFRGR
jgi:hypothetical protein